MTRQAKDINHKMLELNKKWKKNVKPTTDTTESIEKDVENRIENGEKKIVEINKTFKKIREKMADMIDKYICYHVPTKRTDI